MVLWENIVDMAVSRKYLFSLCGWSNPWGTSQKSFLSIFFLALLKIQLQYIL